MIYSLVRTVALQHDVKKPKNGMVNTLKIRKRLIYVYLRPPATVVTRALEFCTVLS